MKRLAWLLLALSLPTWATINGVDSSRVVLPSFDGTRYGMYVAGDFPETPPGVIWIQDFEGIANGTVFSKANMDSTYEALEGLGYNSICDAGVTISDTVARSGSQSLKFFNDISVRADWTNCTDSASKARVEIRVSANQYKTTNLSGYGADLLGFGLGTERWFGYSMYFPTTGNSGWSSAVYPVVLQIFGEGSTDPTYNDVSSPTFWMILGKNGALTADTEFTADAGDITEDQDYLFAAGKVYNKNWAKLTAGEWATLKTYGTQGQKHHLKSIFTLPTPIVRDRWYDVVIHFKRGDTKATGLIEVWLRDTVTTTLTKVVDIPAFPTTREDFPQSYVKTGIYTGQVQTSSETYTMYIDSWRAYDEQGTFNAVDPAQDD